MNRENPETLSPRKPRIYFVVGTVFLFVMAITWSLDSAFVYVSLGIATYFLFLAYHHRARPAQKQYSRTHTKKESNNFFESFKRKLNSTAPQSASENARNFASTVLIVIGAFFMIIIIAVVFSGDPSEATPDYYNRAEEARSAGDYDSAEYYYRKILVDEPENLDALNGLGIISLDQQRYDQAIKQFNEALVANPDYEFARYNKALTLHYQHNYRQSLDEVFELLERNPDYYDAMQLAGENYYEEQRYDSAKYWYRAGYDAGIRNAWLCHVLGYLYDRDKETTRAVELYKEALIYDSTKTDVYVRLGEIYPGEEGRFYRDQAAKLKLSK